MKKYQRILGKLYRAPSVFGMLMKIEWAQARTRGTVGYLQYRAKTLRNHLSTQYPQALQIEPYGGCNLRCTMCFQGRIKLPADRHMMDFGTYKRVIDQMSPFVPVLYLYWRGEPLLHKDLGLMIRYAKEKGMYVFISTNAVTLTEGKAGELRDSGLDFLMIGFDGATKETYEKMRRGADFGNICNNISTIVNLKRRRKSLLPHICLQFIVSSINSHELLAAKRLSKRLGADSFIEKSLDTYENFENEGIHKALTPLYVGGALAKYEEHLGKLRFSGPSSCEMAKRMVVRADGELSLCCYDMQGIYYIGSAQDGGLLKLWMEPEYVELRIEGQNRELPLCINCGSGIQK